MSEEIQAIATNNYLLATPIGSGYMETSALEYDGDKISGYAGSAFKAGDELPESVSAATDYVTATSANIDSTIDNVSANSGAWGGSALPISAGPGIKFEMVDDTLVASNDIVTKLEEPTFAGWYDNNNMIYQAAYTAAFTIGTAYQMPIIISKTDKPWVGADRMWVDPSNSYINYGGTGVRLPISWMLGENRWGSICIVNGGDITHRGRDTSPGVGCTARVNVKWVIAGGE